MFLFSILYQGRENKCFFCTIRTFFEQICSDVQFISPPEEVGEFLLHLLKYGNFLIDNANYVLGLFGISPVNRLGLAAPLGISYYTLQSIGYVLDV